MHRAAIPKLKFCLLGVLMFCAARTLSAASIEEDLRDEIALQGGTVLRGRIVFENPDQFILRIDQAERVVSRTEVVSSKSVFRAQGQILAQYAGLAKNDPASLLALAEQCRTLRLPHEEQLFYWLTLIVDPQHQVAHSRLGHRDKGGRWMVPQRGGAVSFEKLLKLRDTWGKAWELRSEHYTVRCDAGLEQAISTLLELEQCYREFYRLYQDRLKMREVLEPMHVQVFRDRSRFPRIATNVDSYFEEQARILHTFMHEGVPRAIFREATHQLLFQLVEGGELGLGQMPPWLIIGWGEYMEGLLVRPATRRTGILEVQAKRLIEDHRALLERTSEAKRYGVHRVLNFSLSDFEASSMQSLKYAQSYLLFHYLMHAQGDSFQARFMQYLKLAFSGRGQASTFRDSFDVAALEEDVPRYRGR